MKDGKTRLSLVDRRTGCVVFDGCLPSRSSPCPICGKPDWCLTDRARGLTICQRVESPRRIGDAGYMHGASDPDRLSPMVCEVRRHDDAADIDWEAMLRSAHRALDDGRTHDSLERLAADLGLSEASLSCFEVGWLSERECWVFPMRDDAGRIIGMRTRTRDGRKYAVPGSRNGLFIPAGIEHGSGMICVEEGPTSAAAVLELGMDCIGRPSCSACVDMTVRWLERQRRPVAIIANADKDHGGKYPGQSGAAVLASALIGRVPSVRVLIPLIGKDTREWLMRGCSSSRLRAAIEARPLFRPVRGVRA